MRTVQQETFSAQGRHLPFVSSDVARHSGLSTSTVHGSDTWLLSAAGIVLQKVLHAGQAMLSHGRVHLEARGNLGLASAKWRLHKRVLRAQKINLVDQRNVLAFEKTAESGVWRRRPS